MLNVNFAAIIFLLGAAQAVFFAVLLWRAAHKGRLANLYLAMFLLVFAFALIDEFLLYTHYYQRVPYLLGVFWPLDFIYGPLIYFY